MIAGNHYVHFKWMIYAEHFSNPLSKLIPGKITTKLQDLYHKLESGLVGVDMSKSFQSLKPTATITESCAVHLPDSGEVDPLIIPDLQTVQPVATLPTSAPSMIQPAPSMIQPAPPTQFTFSATPTTAAPHKMSWKLCDRKKWPNNRYKSLV